MDEAKKEAVIVIDALNGFLEPGHPLYCGEDARRIVPQIERLLKSKPTAAKVFLCDSHAEHDPEFRMFPPHCVEGTAESQVVPELSPFVGQTVKKQTLDGFFRTDLEQVLKGIGPDVVYVVGVCTDICVLYAVEGLRVRGYEVVVPKHCVASFDQDAHEWALRHLERVLGARVG